MTMTCRRDPFARGELERECVANPYVKHLDWEPMRSNVPYRGYRCATCGNTPPRLYTYEWVSDGGRRNGPSRKFCNLQCWECYQ